MTLKVFKSFRPPISLTVVLLIFASLFIMLGNWQTRRAAEKAETEQQHQSATSLTLETAMSGNSRFSKIRVSGHYDKSRHILLDNQVWNGRGGVYVYTPFYTTGGISILVNRGWLPLVPDRQVMPEIPTPNNELVLTGMLNTPPKPGRMLGPADKLQKDKWPQLVTYMNIEDISGALDAPLESWIIQLSKAEQTGFEGRDWKPVFLSSSRHRAYAFQWFALAAACFVMFILIGFKKPVGKNL